MIPKTFLLLGLLVAVLLIVSEVAAIDNAKETKGEKEVNHPDQYHDGGGRYGDGGGRYGDGGGRYGGGGGRYGDGGGRYGGGGGRYGRDCRYGCCYRGYRGCSRCCSYAGEAVQTQPESKPHV